eukprot:12547749-Alexandrium_andersonii.AAC.1
MSAAGPESALAAEPFCLRCPRGARGPSCRRCRGGAWRSVARTRGSDAQACAPSGATCAPDGGFAHTHARLPRPPP